jgi:hypothetical protein
MAAVPCIIVDIDGTLANTDHRKHHLEKRPKDWDSWHAAADGDAPYMDVMEVVHHCANGLSAEIILCSGRSESQRFQTCIWLRRHKFPARYLYMRKDGDYRPDHIIKIELLTRIRADGFDPLMVFDDRDSVVAAWRSAGLRCFQVAPGNF